MRIVHLANHLLLIGNGIVNMMVDLACSQADAGHEVVVASSGGGFEALLAQHGVRHIQLEQSRDPWRAPKTIASFRRLVREIDPDVVHAHMMTGALIARFGIWRRKYVLVTTVHNEFQRSANLMRVGDRVVAVTRAVEAAMRKRGVPAQRLCTVLNGTVGSPRGAYEQGDPVGHAVNPPQLSHPSIATVAGMYERKGIADLLRAFALVRNTRPDASLYLIGEGPDRAKMEALARELGLDGHAHFVGFMAQTAPWYAQTDVFVLASHKEPAGLVLCEAREAACAIVATRVDGIPEMLDDGEAGLLVPGHSPDALAEAITRLLDDDALRSEYAHRAKSNLEKFSVRRVANDYMDVYVSALDATGRRHRRAANAAVESKSATSDA